MKELNYFAHYSQEVRNSLKEKEIEPGDRIRITSEDMSYEGYILPRIEIGDPSSIVIKQDDGYNVSIAYQPGVELVRIDKGISLESFQKTFPEQLPDLPEISLLATGGTIASRIDYLTGGVVMAFTPEELFFAIPELSEIVRFKGCNLLFNLASEDLWVNEWKKMAEDAAKELNSGASGVVITHGTDCMGYSAAMLSFMLRDLSKPVILTGAQRSSDRGSFDGAINLICASWLAGHADLAGVFICMHGEPDDTYCLINRGTKVRKMHTSRRDTFRPINELPIGKVWPDGKMEFREDAEYKKRSETEVVADTAFEEKIALIKAYPGSNPEIIDFLADKGYRGVIIEGTGLGHTPTSPPSSEKYRSWLPPVKRALEMDLFIGMTSQCLYGRVNPYVYRNLRLMSNAGVVYLEDMLPETAYLKLGWVLGHTQEREEVKRLMLKNIAGEITERTDERAFLY